MIKRGIAKNKVLSQMYDVRPVNRHGDLDVEKINNVFKASYVARDKNKVFSTRIDLAIKPREGNLDRSGKIISEIKRPAFQKKINVQKPEADIFSKKEWIEIDSFDNVGKITFFDNTEKKKIQTQKENPQLAPAMRPIVEWDKASIATPSILGKLNQERREAKRRAEAEAKEARLQAIRKWLELGGDIFEKIISSLIEVSISLNGVLSRNLKNIGLALSGLARLSFIFPIKLLFGGFYLSQKILSLISSGISKLIGKIIFSLLNFFRLIFRSVFAIIRAPFLLIAYLYEKIIDFMHLAGDSFRDSTYHSEEVFPKIENIRPYKFLFSFSAMSVLILIFIFGAGLFQKGIRLKGIALQNGQVAYASLMEAKDGIESKDFNGASLKFSEAYRQFDDISKEVQGLGTVIVESSRFIPFASKLSSGAHLVEAGKNISQIGALSSELLVIFDKAKDPSKDGEAVSFLQLFKESDEKIKQIAGLFLELEDNLNKINLEDVPKEHQDKFIDFKKRLPEINGFLSEFVDQEKIFTDILGGNGPRKYLFLFQNNQEMRATGGFIGTYGLLDIFDGHVKRFFIDGIFNPDGQLREKIVPPSPIQKISANWSLHDSNWFPDFPKSAEKAAWFFEKTGGPTVDGVITMTPTVMQKLLDITGPIYMQEYDVTIDKNNFIENIQQEVEVDYDKDLNQPKKILADLAPIILDKIFNAKNVDDIARTMSVLDESLREKHILIYSKNYEVEKILSANGWSGEILSAQKDYLSIINTNINGYKTDGVIEEEIAHKAEIQSDGSIIDTVTITRRHNGGNSEYDWWNKVNADYMRVYVPKGSKLLSAFGHTREFNQPPIDYDTLRFKRDSQVKMEEDSMVIDEETGTRIYEDSNKIVFGNWVYVSPQETATVTYTYLLPFRLDTNLEEKMVDTYSILFQKQSGSIGSEISSSITYPDYYDVLWRYPDENTEKLSNLPEGKSGVLLEDILDTDKFIGIAFEKK